MKVNGVEVTWPEVGKSHDPTYVELPFAPTTEERKNPKGGRPKRRFCPRGHDTWKIGRNTNGMCTECARLRSESRNREVQAKKRAAKEAKGG